MAKAPKKAKKMGCSNCNPCDDQNGFIVCIGGFPTVIPWPAGTGNNGPFQVIIDPNSENPLQFADLVAPGPPSVAEKPPAAPADGTGCDNL